MIQGGTNPLVSVVMPVRNEESNIAAALACVIEQTYPPESVEILVVDGLSEDRTRTIVKTIGESHSRIHLLDNPKRIAPTALNIGIRAASGAIIIRVDGHCLIPREYIARCVEHLRDPTIAGVGGYIENLADGVVGRSISVAMNSTFGVGGSAFRTIKGRTMEVDTVPFAAYRRDTIDRAGFFDEEMVRNQDDEYNFRIRKAGGKILLAGDVHSTYVTRTSLPKLWRQYFQYGYWKVRVMQKHPRQMRGRHFVPALFILALLGLLTLTSLGAPHAGSTLLLTSGIYLILALVFTVKEGRHEPIGVLVRLPLVYLMLHSSYGSGFLFGLLKFIGRWKEPK